MLRRLSRTVAILVLSLCSPGVLAAPAGAVVAAPTPQKVAARVIVVANEGAYGKLRPIATPGAVRTLRYYRQSGYRFGGLGRCAPSSGGYSCPASLLHRRHVISALTLEIARVDGVLRVVEVSTSDS